MSSSPMRRNTNKSTSSDSAVSLRSLWVASRVMRAKGEAAPVRQSREAVSAPSEFCRHSTRRAKQTRSCF